MNVMQKTLPTPHPLKFHKAGVVESGSCVARIGEDWVGGHTGAFGHHEKKFSDEGASPIAQHALVFPLAEYSFEWYSDLGTHHVKRYPGQVAFLPAGCELGYKIISGQPKYLLAVLSKELLSSVAGWRPTDLVAFDFEDETLTLMAASLQSARVPGPAFDKGFLDAMLQAIALRFWSIYSDQHEIARQEGVPTVAAAQSFAKSRLGFPLLADDLAKAANISTSQLNRDFKKVTGMGVMSWLREERLRQAESLLLGSNLTVSQIAEQVGFSDGPHLTRLFANWKGSTPAKFRESIRHQSA